MAIRTPRPRRPAKLSRWAASGLTAAVTVGAVAAMTEGAEDDEGAEIGEAATGVAIGAAARYEGELAAATMMSAADPGVDAPTPLPPPRIGGAGVS